jgi:redox-sensitive bicupin YhaK (pirin superfamily)
MKTIIHKADTRGHSNYGWLDTHYTFSFANYYNPERVNFGTLRVLNDDFIDGGQGFDRHPHDNMEIVTIPLEGELEHIDSMGNKFLIRKNDIQVMSAGTGIFHSEYNKLPDKPVRLLQIWVFPEKRNITPRYDQKTYRPEDRINKWQRIVSPNENEVAWINQKAYFSLISLDKGKTIPYLFNDPKNGAYLFVIDGSVSLDGIQLEKRDGLGVWETSEISLTALKKAELLLMEIPME